MKKDQTAIGNGVVVSQRSVRQYFIALSLVALIAVGFSLATPSEMKVAVFLGYSAMRLTLVAMLLGIAMICVWLAFGANRVIANTLTNLWKSDDAVYLTMLLLCFALFVGGWLLLFSWLFVPANLRPAILWGCVAVVGAMVLLRRAAAGVFTRCSLWRHYSLLPDWNAIAESDRVLMKRTMAILAVLSLLYLVILIPSNVNGTRDMDAFARYGGDEYVIYPILMDVMEPGETFSATLYHLFIYEDYHYGYPFYAASTLLLKPVQWVCNLRGIDFREQVQVNLPLLRFGVSVVPLILSAWVLTFLFTRFKRPLVSALTFLFVILAPGSLQNNQGFWHPDGLNLLFVCLTLYFLQRDRYRFGRNFIAAAVTCGLSIATRLYGFFFFLAIAVLILMAVGLKKISWGRAIQVGVIFIAVMMVTAALASPYLFRADARAKMVAIMTEKTGEMAHGYEGDYDPRGDHRTGWDAWYPAFEDHYVKQFCFWFLALTLLTGSFIGAQQLTYRMVASWCLVITGYLVFFVAVKSTQYVLPALLPMMSAIFGLPIVVEEEGMNRRVCIAAWVAAACVFVIQLAVNLVIIRPRFF